MNILRWVLVTAIAMAFLLLSVANWTPVDFNLPDGTPVKPPLPILMGAAFIAGWLPTWLFHIAARANWRRKARLGTADDRGSSLPLQAQPSILPPAGA